MQAFGIGLRKLKKTLANKIGRANRDEPFRFVAFLGRARRLIRVAHLVS